MQGLSGRITSAGIPVVRLHYTADPARRTEQWLKEAVSGYPGGISGSRWRKEQEIDYGASGGTLLFPLWDQWKNTPIICHSIDTTGLRLYGSYDHGWNNPACYLVHGVDSDGNIITLWEFYADHVPIYQIAKIILGETVKLPDGRLFQGNPYARREVQRIADPSMWAENVPMQDGPNKTSEFLFRQGSVLFHAGERGGDITVAEWLHGWFWENPQLPKYRIHTDCKKLIWEIGRQKHKEYSAKVAVTRDQPETLVDKDNHAWDALKMFLRRFPPPANLIKSKAEVGNTFQWWKKQRQRQMMGQSLQTYRHKDA